MVKVKRCYYRTENPQEQDLENFINLVGYDNILMIFSEYYEDNEVAYTVIYNQGGENNDEISISLRELKKILEKVGPDYKFGDVIRIIEKHYGS